MTHEQVTALFEAWIKQRPGLDPRDYGGGLDGWRAYRNEANQIARDRQRALTALDEFARHPYRESLLLHTLTRVYCGRLSLNLETGKFEYCTGQYWPTEYRIVAAVVLEYYNRTVCGWGEQ